MIANDAGWNTSQTLGLTIGSLMFLALLVAPPVVTLLSRRRKTGGRS